MTHDNALRTPNTPEIVRTRIHLVHSRSWQVDRRVQKLARPSLVPEAVPQVRSRTADTLMLTAAALTAPLVWAGHALLRAMNVP